MKKYLVILKSSVYDAVSSNEDANNTLSDDDREELINFNRTLFSNTQEELIMGLFYRDGEISKIVFF